MPLFISRYAGEVMKICLISNAEGTWVIQDIEILNELGYEVKKVVVKATFGPYRIMKLFFKAFFPAYWSDIIFCWFAFPSGFVGVLLSKMLRKQVIVNAVGVDVTYVPAINYGLLLKPYWRWLLNWTLMNADNVIAISKESADNVQNLVSKDVEIIYEGIDVERFRPIKVTKPKQNIILTVGVLSKLNLKRKGFELLVKCIPYVVKEFSNVKFVFVGKKKGGYPVLRDLIEKLGILDYVDFKGYKPDEELIRLYNQCTIFALPSIHEGFPTVISEALACEKPVVSTRLSAIPEVVVNYETGILIGKPQSPEELACAIVTLLKIPSLRTKMGENGREIIAQRFSRKIRKQRMKKMLESLVTKAS